VTDLRDAVAPPLRRAEDSVSGVLQRRPLLGPLLAGALGTLVSLIGMTMPSVWYDEAATISAATRGWPELWRMLDTVDAVHGLYYVMMHLVFDVVGYSPFSLRAPSALAVGVAAALTVVLVRQFARPGTALIAGVVFVALPRVTWMGTEGRSYAAGAALAVGLTILLVHAVRTRRRRWWVAYTAVAILACGVFVYLALIVVAHGVTMAWWLAAARRAAIRDVVRWGLAAAISAVSVLPLALEIVSQDAQVQWIEPLGAATPRQVFRTQWFLYADEFATLAWVLIAIAVVLLVARSRGLSFAAVLLPALVVPTVALLIATETYSPLYSPRYVTMGTPFAAAAIAVTIAATRFRVLQAAVLALVVAMAVPSAIQERMPRAKQQSTWSEVAALVAAQRAEDGADSRTAMIWGPVRYHAAATARVIEYSYPYAFDGTVDVTLRTPAAEASGLWETRGRLDESLDRLEGADAAYLVTSIKRDRRASTTEALSTIGWVPTDEWNLVDVNILRYEPAAPQPAG